MCIRDRRSPRATRARPAFDALPRTPLLCSDACSAAEQVSVASFVWNDHTGGSDPGLLRVGPCEFPSAQARRQPAR
eukprot:11409577-Alexandrium_andersonii.AAC.1